jgi:predicted RNA binding protein YcfA (HicA-like mRNA interferase family)
VITFDSNSWNQIKGITIQRLRKALIDDEWLQEEKRGAVQAFRHPEINRRVTLHMHPKKTMGPRLLKSLLKDTGWTNEDLVRLGLIK